MAAQSATTISSKTAITSTRPTSPADAEDGLYTKRRTFQLKDEATYQDTDGTPIGPSGGAGWNKVPSKPYVANLSAKVSGTSLGVTYEAGVK